ncbi:MAG: hypothetical protein R6U13_10830 [Desulfatiglandaceae bacterium]
MSQRPLVILFIATAAGIIAGHHLHVYLLQTTGFLWLLPLLFAAAAVAVRSGRWTWVICGVFSAGLALEVSLLQPSVLAEIASRHGVHTIEATVCEPTTDYPRYHNLWQMLNFIIEHPLNKGRSKNQ